MLFEFFSYIIVEKADFVGRQLDLYSAELVVPQRFLEPTRNDNKWQHASCSAEY